MRDVAIVAVAAASVIAAFQGSAAPAERDGADGRREVVFVANAEGGTVTIVDAHTFRSLSEIDVLPDGEDARPTEDDPVQALVGQRLAEAAGGDNFAQDQDLSPDGLTLYVSRGHRGDVAAFDLSTGGMRWKLSIPGFRADHMTLSPDGAYLYVSALTDDHVQVVDTRTVEIIGTIPTGEWPHDDHLSHDGRRLYNGSIGNIITPWEVREQRVANPLTPSPYQLTVADAFTFEVLRTYDFDRGIRPFLITDDETRMYAQLSELHGLIEYDLVEGRELRRLELPIDEGVTEDDYSFEAPHHGLAMTPDGSRLCAAGRASDYVAIVETAALEPIAITEVGDAPSWAVTGPDGRTCFVANTRDDTLSVIAYADGRELARIEVGDGPKHLEVGAIPADVFARPRGEGSSAGGPAPREPSGGDLPATGGGAVAPMLVSLAAVSAFARRRRTG